jgi:hypothetical protein
MIKNIIYILISIKNFNKATINFTYMIVLGTCLISVLIVIFSKWLLFVLYIIQFKGVRDQMIVNKDNN